MIIVIGFYDAIFYKCYMIKHDIHVASVYTISNDKYIHYVLYMSFSLYTQGLYTCWETLTKGKITLHNASKAVGRLLRKQM